MSKSTFNIQYGYYELLVLSIGLINIPIVFMHLMNHIFIEYLVRFVIVFIDDMLIYFPDYETHVMYLKIVLKTLQEHQLYGKCSKYFWLIDVDFWSRDLSPRNGCRYRKNSHHSKLI